MRARDGIGLTLAPLILRLMLATTFIWAGLGKVFEHTMLEPEQAAQLANLGGLTKRAPAAPSKPSRNGPASPLREPTAPTAVTPNGPAPASAQPGTPSETPPQKPENGSADSPATEPEAEPERGSSRSFPALARLSPTTPNPPVVPASSAPTADGPAPGTATPGPYTAADFPEPVKVVRGMALALMLDDAAHPKARADGSTPTPLWPATLAGKPWPVVLAWAAIFTEIIGGALLLLGLFTRLAAMGIAGTTVVAMWLTQLGPAIQAGGATLGFLPAHDTFDVAAWQPLMWQFSLLGASLALVFLGSGPAGLDAAIFGGPTRTVVVKKKAVLED